ncbi:hypothetical protein GCM10009799_21240 [Nocardiopsis rhodophaea]|uniref:Uncharacterized protein n=1 Tax=Nocardiopsis rhodophaea TaxID=280238 RepID=A0ABN2SYN7_9ACTN
MPDSSDGNRDPSHGGREKEVTRRWALAGIIGLAALSILVGPANEFSSALVTALARDTPEANEPPTPEAPAPAAESEADPEAPVRANYTWAKLGGSLVYDDAVYVSAKEERRRTLDWSCFGSVDACELGFYAASARSDRLLSAAAA